MVHLDDLIDRIKKDHRARVKADEPMMMNIYSATRNPDKSTTELNGNFIHYLLLIDALIKIKYNETDKKQLIKICKDKYSDNDEELECIREFDHDYKPKKVIWWYTRDIFLYKMLNKALRVQNTELLYLFRFVIRDLYQQLKENQCKTPIQTYRYQSLSNDELRALQRSMGQFISIDSFFSTSSNREVALGFLRNATVTNDLQKILFVIQADPRVVKSKPFADISALSSFSQESEVLFMVGCIFRLMDIRRDNDQKCWIIQIQLAGDDENELKDLFNELKKECGVGDQEADLLSFGNILQSMGNFDLAEKVYSNLREKCSTDDTSYHHLCYSLALLYAERKDFDRSLRWFEKALDRKIRTDPSDFLYIAGLHCSIGNIYIEKHNYNEAMNHYNTALEVYKMENATNHVNMASLYHGIARVRYFQEQYSDALNYYQQSLLIQGKHLPSNHADMAVNYSGIGDVYFCLKEYQHAMENYMRSLNIRKKSLPPRHPHIATNNRSIGKIHEAVNQWKEALEFYEKALFIYKQSLPSDHPDVIEVNENVKRVKSKLI